jgi:FkbM family methyltransferase
MRKHLSYLKYKLKKEYDFFSTYKTKTGIKFADYFKLKLQNKKDNSKLFGKEIKVPNAFWHLHSLNEIFIEETYKFKTSNPSPLIIDCGSNIGLSIIYFKINHPHARVIGFEPDPNIFELLENNLKQFDFSNVEINNQAVWIKDDEIIFNAIGDLGGTLSFTEKINQEYSNEIVVKAIRLKNLLRENKVDFLKIDVEGAEFELLDDCFDELINVENIFIEYHRLKGKNIQVGSFISKLEEKGFRIYIKEAWNNLPNPYCHKDFAPMYDLQLNIFGYRH